MPVARTRPKLHAWLELLRAPNLLTVPGDPLAGFFLAGGRAAPAAAWATVSALCLYACGLLLNDWADCRVDARERPARPIPSGRVGRGVVLAAALALALAGLGAGAQAGTGAAVAAGMLLALIASYDVLTKSVPVLGVLNMGACRGASVLLGACAAGWTPAAGPVAMGAAGVLAYIAAVSLIARREMESCRYGAERWLPAVALALALAAVAAAQRHAPPGLLAFGVTGVGWAWLMGARLARADTPPRVGRLIGGWIRGLLLAQAALCAAGGTVAGTAAGLALVAAFPASAWLGRRFAAS